MVEYPELLIVPVVAVLGLLVMVWGDKPGQKRVVYMVISASLFTFALYLALRLFSEYTRRSLH